MIFGTLSNLCYIQFKTKITNRVSAECREFWLSNQFNLIEILSFSLEHVLRTSLGSQGFAYHHIQQNGVMCKAIERHTSNKTS